MTNVSPGLIFQEAYFRKDILVSIHGGLYSGAYIREGLHSGF